MEEFEISGNGDFIRISIIETFGFPNNKSFLGGYDVKCNVIIEIDDFKVNSTLYSSTGEIYEFYQMLLHANSSLTGNLYFRILENNLEFAVIYDVNGLIKIEGYFRNLSCKLNFEFSTDQSYIQSTLKQLNVIASKYGDNKGKI